MEHDLAASLAQTMKYCWERNLAASLAPPTASMMVTMREPHLVQTMAQCWVAMTEPGLVQMMVPATEHHWDWSLATHLVPTKASTMVTTMELATAQPMAEC